MRLEFTQTETKAILSGSKGQKSYVAPACCERRSERILPCADQDEYRQQMNLVHSGDGPISEGLLVTFQCVSNGCERFLEI
jgi:hypothetical protein